MSAYPMDNPLRHRIPVSCHSTELVMPSNRKNFFVTSFRKNKTNATEKQKKISKVFGTTRTTHRNLPYKNIEIRLGIFNFIYENYNFQITNTFGEVYIIGDSPKDTHWWEGF